MKKRDLKVISIKSARTKEPNPNAVQVLEELLGVAKKGGLRQLFFVYTGFDDEGDAVVGSGHALETRSPTPFDLVGAIESAKLRLIRDNIAYPE